MVMVSPFANSVRATPVQGSVQASAQGLGSIAQLLQQLKSAGPRAEAGARIPQEQPSLGIAKAVEPTMTYDQAMSRSMQQDVKSPQENALIEAAIARGPSNMGPDNTRLPVASIDFGPRRRPFMPSMGPTMSNDPAENYNMGVPALSGLDEYKALRDYQKESRNRLQELQSALRGTQGYKDFRLNQLEDMYANRPQMGMGLGMANPYGMQPFRQPMRQPMPMPRGGYNQYQNQFGGMMGMQQQPYQQQQYGIMGGYQQNPYQQMRPQPQQFGGYGMGQQMGGYGSFGGMPNPYQPQQMGYNQNNYSGYAGQQNFAAFG
jgi:hypothetical protein